MNFSSLLFIILINQSKRTTDNMISQTRKLFAPVRLFKFIKGMNASSNSPFSENFIKLNSMITITSGIDIILCGDNIMNEDIAPIMPKHPIIKIK